MPARTSFYLIWHGTPQPDARKSNSLFALWDDPDFAPIRSAILENLVSESKEDSGKPKLTAEEAEQYSTLVENPFVLAYLRKPEGKSAAKTSPASNPDHQWNGLFFVYDRTGKEALLSKAILRMRAQGTEKELPQISPITVAGIPMLKIQRDTGVTYWVEHGKYAVSASELSVLEEVLAVLTSKSAPASSLAQTAAYREAQPLFGDGPLEFFVRIPNLKDLAPETGPSGFKLAPALDALRLDSIHSICGHITLEGSKTRVQATVLGDVAAGTLFDLWPDGQSVPASLALVPAEAVSFSETQFNLPAIYGILKRVVRSVLPQAQQGNTDMVEALAQARLGMPIADALSALSGEFASIQLDPAMDPHKAVIFLGIHKKAETLKLIHAIFGNQVSPERTEGDATFLKVSLQGGQGEAGVAQSNFYHLAVTPDMVLGASRSEILGDLLAKRAQASAPSSLGAAPGFQAARTHFPDKLNSFSYFDFQKLDWQALKDRSLKEANAASKKESTSSQTSSNSKDADSKHAGPPAAPKVPDWMIQVNPQVFSRHLHFITGASWKDSKGIHLDQWVE
jgi:hypothetical protein